jgi:hypothetical protein
MVGDAQRQQPLFLGVQLGDLVVVQASTDWWIGQVIHVEGSARSQAPSLFQVACVDTGIIRSVNGNAVVAILQTPATPAGPGSGSGSGTLQPPDDQAHQHEGAGQGNQQGNRHGAARWVA